MKKTLIIGSSVVDVIINIMKMPKSGEDENIISQHFSMGGCAFNVSQAMKYQHVPYTLFSPIGTGFYGRYVKNYFLRHHIPILIETEKRNGCCYCFVDQLGERSFICEHGAEYLFKKEWFEKLDQEYDQVYICGLEIEEESGNVIINFLRKHPQMQVYFAPGPRICSIPMEKMKKMMKMRPILHLNLTELLSYTRQEKLEEALKIMYKLNRNIIIVTLGENGSLYFDGHQTIYEPAFKTRLMDTVGAGDSHIGTILAMQAQDKSWPETLQEANRVAAIVVGQRGANLKMEDE